MGRLVADRLEPTACRERCGLSRRLPAVSTPCQMAHQAPWSKLSESSETQLSARAPESQRAPSRSLSAITVFSSSCMYVMFDI